MVDPTTLARPYAKACFKYALEADDLSLWEVALFNLGEITKNQVVNVFLRDPGKSFRQQTDLVLELLGETIPIGLDNLITVMAENRRLVLLPEVSKVFSSLKQQAQNSVTVEVTAAYPLEHADICNLAERMKNYLNQAVTITTKTDPSLLAGAVIRAGDLVIDGSVRGRLNKLVNALA